MRARQDDPELRTDARLIDTPASPPASKRKVAKTKRWAGMAPVLPFAFAWDRPAARGAPTAGAVLPSRSAAADPGSTQSGGDVPESQPRTAPLDRAAASEGGPRADVPQPMPADFTDPLASLPPLWESLADYLCLLQCAPVGASSALYGSAARVHTAHDERDDAQWLCADILDPAFSKHLPKECSQLRTKCFGPSAASTPLRSRRRRSETVSAPRPASAPVLAKSETRTMIRAGWKQKEVHMPRQLKRSTSTSGTKVPVVQHKRKRPASRWGAATSAPMLVCATPEKPRASAPVLLGSVSPSPPPPLRSFSAPRAQKSDERASFASEAEATLRAYEPSLGLAEEATVEAPSPKPEPMSPTWADGSDSEKELTLPTWRKAAWPLPYT